MDGGRRARPTLGYDCLSNQSNLFVLVAFGSAVPPPNHYLINRIWLPSEVRFRRQAILSNAHDVWSRCCAVCNVRGTSPQLVLQFAIQRQLQEECFNLLRFFALLCIQVHFNYTASKRNYHTKGLPLYMFKKINLFGVND